MEGTRQPIQPSAVKRGLLKTDSPEFGMGGSHGSFNDVFDGIQGVNQVAFLLRFFYGVAFFFLHILLCGSKQVSITHVAEYRLSLDGYELSTSLNTCWYMG